MGFPGYTPFKTFEYLIPVAFVRQNRSTSSRGRGEAALY